MVPTRCPSPPTPTQAPDPVYHAVLHVFRQVASATPMEDRERFATAIAQRAGVLRDAQLRTAQGQVEAVARAVPPMFQTLATRPGGRVDLAGAVSLMALQAQKTEARWVEAMKAAHAARQALEIIVKTGILPPTAQAAIDQINALAPEPPPAPVSVNSPHEVA